MKQVGEGKKVENWKNKTRWESEETEKETMKPVKSNSSGSENKEIEDILQISI